MNYSSKVERPYAIDVVSPVGTGLRVTIKNYSKQECDEVMKRLKDESDKFRFIVLIEMASHDYMIYPSAQDGMFTQDEWYGAN